MGIRIVVGLSDDAAPSKVAEQLLEAGAEEILPVRAELPRVLVALFPDMLGPRAAAEEAARVTGVAYARPDTPESET
ncbi:hypothetical protein ACFOY2_16590 [Nonomuraea purpurea]|uniref:SPOR domain-containing protein n=1 Tax=Nonomuraea purpurea TaxID=1849276 RepID=A0ABV8G4B9_9ACTN